MFIAIILLAAISYAHGDETEYNLDYNGVYPISQWSIVGYGIAALGILVAVMVMFHKKMSEITKKIVYWLVAGVAILVTVYMIIVTLHLNVISLSKAYQCTGMLIMKYGHAIQR